MKFTVKVATLDRWAERHHLIERPGESQPLRQREIYRELLRAPLCWCLPALALVPVAIGLLLPAAAAPSGGAIAIALMLSAVRRARAKESDRSQD